jgi:hypothetical protein
MANPTSNFGWQMPTNTDLVKDLPADFETFGQAVDTSMADLKGGTTGQILSKNSNTDMDFVWIANDQGDITGITATSPLTGGGTSGAITVGIQSASTTQSGAVQLTDSTSSTSTTTAATPNSVKSSYDLAAAAIPKSTVTTNGDLIYGTGSSTVTRLGIGSSGQVLTVSGGVPAWTTSSAGGMTSIASGSLSSNTLTISSISGSYVNLLLYVRDFYFAADDYLNIRFNSDTGNSYGWVGIVQTAENTCSLSADGIRDRLYATADDGKESSDKNTFASVLIYDYANSAHNKTVDIRSVVRDQTDVYNTQSLTFANYNSTTAISSITIFTQNTSNFSGGTYELYGVK